MRISNHSSVALRLFFGTILLMPLMMTDPANAKGCVHIMKATGKSALRQGKAEKNAVQAFLNVAFSRFGNTAYTQWAHVPGRKLICKGGARKTCVASGVPCRAKKAKSTRPVCITYKKDSNNRQRAVYQIITDGDTKDRMRDVCEISWRQAQSGPVILPAPNIRKLTCPRGYRLVLRKGPDICRK
ncbi:MAG: hypothetical protein N4A65_00750 [Cohaesibacter sp.]|nr:hypothetical protein [Cohaesibacter sp.]